MDIFIRLTFPSLSVLCSVVLFYGLHSFWLEFCRPSLFCFVCDVYFFPLWLLLRFSSLSLVFSSLVMMCLGMAFFMFIFLRTYWFSLDHSVDDFHQSWEILGHFVLHCHTLGFQYLWTDSLMLGLFLFSCCLFVFKQLLSVLHIG